MNLMKQTISPCCIHGLFVFFAEKTRAIMKNIKTKGVTIMNEMYFSVPQGTHELTFGILDDEGGWKSFPTDSRLCCWIPLRN